MSIANIKFMKWSRFCSYNRGRKWNVIWKKGNRKIVFNEGGWYFAFDIVFAPKFGFRFFFYFGIPLIISFRHPKSYIGGWQTEERKNRKKKTRF